MTVSAHKLIVAVSTAATLLITSAVMANAPTGGTRPGQTGTRSGKGATTTTTPSKITIAANKEQQLKANREFREKLHEQALRKEQMLKDKNSGDGSGGIVITHGGGNLPKEPGNNPDKNWGHNCGKDYCSKDYCFDHYRSSCYSECSYVNVEPMNTYVVLPGDTFESISLKLFGNPTDSANIAMFNRMPIDSALAPGQVLMLPSISKTL
ncbi:MAG TPA: LysM domain-containing protein [Lacipirellulaceae bacterium]|jgi:nucleoid-associated protein YgaU|nr:LysM domain-containing protein [Lacipirellulaceae bacterium]